MGDPSNQQHAAMTGKHSGSGSDQTQTRTGSVDMLPAGTVLADRYRIEEVLGVGGQGLVYRARDIELDTDIAVKLLRAERQADEETLARFRREVLLARKVSHPNVLRLHDIGQDGDLLFLTMDFVPGRTLREVLGEGPLNVEQTVRLGSEIADALAVAHEQQIIHRDLKPANILVGDDGRARLLDFGVARALDTEQLTIAGEVVGTPAYLAPEQVRGDPVDHRSDIFSLGLILCEALTGRLPQGEGTLEELMGQRATGRTLDPASLEPQLPRWLVGILRNCLAARPEGRYQRAKDLKKDLQSGRTRSLRRRRSITWAAVGAVALMVAVAAVLMLPERAERLSQPVATTHVAVLPVANLTGRATLDWAGRSLAQSLSDSLAEAPELQVTDSLRVFRLIEDLGMDPEVPGRSERRQLFDLLNVDYLVGGRLHDTDDGQRVELLVYRPGQDSGQRIAAHSESGAPLGILPELTAQLFQQLTGASPSLPLAPTSENPQALEYFDRGMELMARRETIAAVEPFEQAVSADRGFAAAWTHLARALAAAGHRDRAIDSAEKAVSLLADHGGRLALEAQAALAELSGQPEQSQQTLDKLIEQFPGDVRARIRLAELLIDQGRLDSAIAQLEQVVVTEPQNAEAWFLLGKAAIMSGDPARAAEDYLVRALVIENRTGSVQGRGDVVNALGISHLQLGNLEDAADYFDEAVELRMQAGDRRGAAATRANLAHLSMLMGDFGRAQQELALAIEDHQALGDRSGMADLYNQKGVVEEERGDFLAALDSYREALRLYESVGHGRGLADTYNNVAFAHFMLGDYVSARQFNRSALDWLEGEQRPALRIRALETRGYLDSARGDWEGALSAFLEALELSRELNQPHSEAVARGGIGLVAADQGRFGAALEALETALEIITDLGDVRGQAIYQLRLAELDVRAARYSQAGHQLQRVEQVAGEFGSIMIEPELLRMQARLLAATGNRDQAVALAEQALSRARDGGLTIHALKAEMMLAGLQDASRWPELVTRAERTGDALLVLESLTGASEAALDAGQPGQAGQLARQALRPPARVTPWHGNWRLHWVVAQAERAEGVESPAALAEAREEVLRLAADMPEDWVADFTTRLPDELHEAEIESY